MTLFSNTTKGCLVVSAAAFIFWALVYLGVAMAYRAQRDDVQKLGGCITVEVQKEGEVQ